MTIGDVRVRAVLANDEPRLRLWADDSLVAGEAFLDLPHGFVNRSVETAVAESGTSELICSVTGSLGVILDPLIKNPEASSGEVMKGLLLAARSLEFWATTLGALDSFIAIPNSMPEYQELVKKCGYEEMGDGCRIFTRKLNGEAPGEPVV